MRGNKHFGMMSASNVGSRRSAINGCDSQVRRWMLGCCPKGLWVFYSKSPLHLCRQSQSASGQFEDQVHILMWDGWLTANLRKCACAGAAISINWQSFFWTFLSHHGHFKKYLPLGPMSDNSPNYKVLNLLQQSQILSRRWIQSMNKIRILPDTCKYYNTSTSLHCVERTS